MTNIYNFTCEKVGGKKQDLSEYRGKVMLIVNTASKCGLTPQFTALEQIFDDYKDNDFSVLGFPCNQFARQEPASNETIQEFCQLNYGVSFPVYAKVDVNGDNTSPLFKHLKSKAPGILGSETIKWNFTKFLVDADGKVVKRYAPATKPEAIRKDIERLLA
ncbi:MAG: glutathione peroxidase [Pseudomonadales bacterium]|nr:glutathione peroxidase [Pseudomonadales bacterium]